MAVEKTKHEFVDDNPYLVYSGEPESTLDNAGGGSGDSAKVLLVTVTNTPQASNNFTLVSPPIEDIIEEWQKQEAIPIIKKAFFYGGSEMLIGNWNPYSASPGTTGIMSGSKTSIQDTSTDYYISDNGVSVLNDGTVDIIKYVVQISKTTP